MYRCLRIASWLILLSASSSIFGQELSAPAPPGLALAFAGYLGGFGLDSVQAVAVDKDGGVWVAGSTSSTMDFPGPNVPFQAAITGGADIFLAKYRMHSDGTSEVLFWTWIGGTGNEDVRAMALDANGRVYLTGSTTSTDFPMGGYAFQTSNAGGTDSYILIVDPSLSGSDSLVFSSYYGGTLTDVATALAIEPSGAVDVVGYTTSQDLPNVSGNAQINNRGGWEAFLFRVDPSSPSGITYATYYGGASTDVATGVAVDKQGLVWITGYTMSNDFPTSGSGLNLSPIGTANGFLVALNLGNAGLDAIIYGTYFGGDNYDVPQKMVIDASGAIWIAGYTLSGQYPTTATAAQNYFGGGSDMFVTKFDMTKPPDQVITYSTFLGGGDADVLHGFTLLGNGKFAVCGYTMSNDMPVAGPPVQAAQASPFADVYVAVVDSNITGRNAAVVYASYFGGAYTDVANDIAADAAGNLYLGGYTNSLDLQVTDGSTKLNDQPLTTGLLLKIGK